jgi:hypothetical protein
VRSWSSWRAMGRRVADATNACRMRRRRGDERVGFLWAAVALELFFFGAVGGDWVVDWENATGVNPAGPHSSDQARMATTCPR